MLTLKSRTQVTESFTLGVTAVAFGSHLLTEEFITLVEILAPPTPGKGREKRLG